MTIREFKTITGNVVEVETQLEVSCHHKHIKPIPMQLDEIESKYQCNQCGMIFNALEMHALTINHHANTKPLSREEFDKFPN